MRYLLQFLFVLIILGLLQTGCDLREGTIVYDVEFPRANEVDTDDGSGSGSGSGVRTVSLLKSGASLAENGGTVTLTAELSAAASTNTSVILSLSGNATVISDYTLSDNITINAGNTTGTATLTGINDAFNDDGEQIIVDISAVSGGDGASENGTQQQTVTISDDDSASTVTLSGTASVTEGNSGTTNATITATLDRTTSTNTTVILTASGTAAGSGTDYTLSSSTITITAGNTTGTATVGVVGETTAEDNETVILDITGVSGGDGASESGIQRVTITIVNDDLAAPVLDNATPAELQNTIYWQIVSGADNYTLYWDNVTSNVTTTDDNITISGGSTSSYVHGGLDNGTVYYYRIVANSSSGSSDLSNRVNGTPLAYTGCKTSGVLIDNDTDLLVYYPFDGDLKDNASRSDIGGPFDLTNANGTISFPQSCAYGLAGYFNSKTGYAYNNSFDEGNVPQLSDNYTIVMWFNADEDMGAYSSLISSRNVPETGNDGGVWSFQLDDKGNQKLRWRSAQGESSDIHNVANVRYTKHQWTHLAAVKHDNETTELYMNGSLVGSNNNHNTGWSMMKIGINRRNEPDNQWKGYIDEVKVYGRALTSLEVIDKCASYTQCPIAPPSPTITATAGTRQNIINWNNIGNADNYTIQWSTDNSTWNTILVGVGNTSYTHTSLTSGTFYSYKLTANNSYGSSPESNIASAVPTGSSTSFTKGVNFTSGNGYLVQHLSDSDELPLKLSGQGDSSINNGNTTSTGQPWAVAVVFNPSSIPTGNVNVSYRSLWSQAPGIDQNSYRISLDLIPNGRVRFYFGKNYDSSNNNNWYKWTSNTNFVSSNNWYGLYIDYDGGRRNHGSGSSSDRLKNFNRFRIWQVNLDNGTATRLTRYGQADTDNGSWKYNNNVGNDIVGQFYVGSQYQNNKEFEGHIASTVVTTLRNNQPLPDATEISMIVNDPMNWLNTYKVGNNWRQPDREGTVNEYSGFASGNDNNGAEGTKVWLMGNGTNDSYDNIRNQVSNASEAQELNMVGMSSGDIQNITVP